MPFGPRQGPFEKYFPGTAPGTLLTRRHQPICHGPWGETPCNRYRPRKAPRISHAPREDYVNGRMTAAKNMIES